MIHLIYISSATSWPREEDLKDLLLEAREKNLRQSVTGMLLYDNATYMQVLEGNESDVYKIFESIKRDPRNTGIVKLVEENISKRDFPDWSMGFKDLKSCDPNEVPGYIDIFNGNIDKKIAENNGVHVKELLLSFSTFSSR